MTDIGIVGIWWQEEDIRITRTEEKINVVSAEKIGNAEKTLEAGIRVPIRRLSVRRTGPEDRIIGVTKTRVCVIREIWKVRIIGTSYVTDGNGVDWTIVNKIFDNKENDETMTTVGIFSYNVSDNVSHDDVHVVVHEKRRLKSIVFWRKMNIKLQRWKLRSIGDNNLRKYQCNIM